MSSFVGHSLAGLFPYYVTQPKMRPFRSAWASAEWRVWLVVVAAFPDVDKAIPALNASQHNGLRISHSVAFSLLLPVFSAIALYLFNIRGSRLKTGIFQATFAGVSHPMLDLFVGVIGLPLLWPFHAVNYYAPIGLLPSAGVPQLRNPYFYINLGIELGILLPLCTLILGFLPWRSKKLPIVLALILAAIFLYFLTVSMQLSR